MMAPTIMEHLSSAAPSMWLWGHQGLERPFREHLGEGSRGLQTPSCFYSSHAALICFTYLLMMHLSLTTGFPGETCLRTQVWYECPGRVPTGTLPASVQSSGSLSSYPSLLGSTKVTWPSLHRMGVCLPVTPTWSWSALPLSHDPLWDPRLSCGPFDDFFSDTVSSLLVICGPFSNPCG